MKLARPARFVLSLSLRALHCRLRAVACGAMRRDCPRGLHAVRGVVTSRESHRHRRVQSRAPRAFACTSLGTQYAVYRKYYLRVEK
eukprot:734297-Pleurochrysis_carterae.AAC.15